MPLAASLLKAQLDSTAEINDKLDVFLMDFYVENSAELISEKIFKESPDMVGFSVYLWNRPLVEQICHIIKNRFPGTILFAGGAEATAFPLNLLNSAPFDFVVKGEGELPLAEAVKKILKKESYLHIDGIYTGKELNNSEKNQWPVPDLDLIPSPFLTGVLDLKKYRGVLWELSRGCPFKCSFCFESRGVEGVRQFPLNRIQKELELFESVKVNQVFVLDPTFNRDVTRAKKILRMIQKTAPLIHFTFEARTEFIDAEMAGLFAGINCSLQIGLQSAIPGVLSNVNRKIDPEKYAEKISLLNSSGVIFGLDLIYGLPGDNLEGFKYSLNYALRLQPNHLDIFPLAVLPGTALYDDAGSFSLKYLHEAPYTLISSPGFSEADMIAAESLKNACNTFYNIGGAAGWMFMVLETLDIDPSDFLESFTEYTVPGTGDKELLKNAVTGIQLSFVKEQFDRHDKKELFPVMEDIITIHGAMNCSLYAGPYSLPLKKSFNDNTLFRLTPGTMIITLKYSFDDLMTLGDFDLEEFMVQYRPEKTYVIIYNCTGEIKPLVVDKQIFKLMQSFTGKLPLKDFLKNNSSIAKEDVYEFIEYAVSETMISVF